MLQKGREKGPSLTGTQDPVGYASSRCKGGEKKTSRKKKKLHNQEGTFTQPAGQPSGRQGALAMTVGKKSVLCGCYGNKRREACGKWTADLYSQTEATKVLGLSGNTNVCRDRKSPA